MREIDDIEPGMPAMLILTEPSRYENNEFETRRDDRVDAVTSDDLEDLQEMTGLDVC